MRTLNPRPGKFEGNSSQLLAEVVYNVGSNGFASEVCSAEGFGHYELIKGRRYWFILCEDGQGFVSVECGTSGELLTTWDKIEHEYSEFCRLEDGE